MTEARVTKIKTSLAKQMAQPGGRTVAEVERRANERLNRHKSEVMDSIGERISELETLAQAKVEGTRIKIYAVAKGLLDTAGFFDTGPLYEVGYSLCETADLMMESNRWNWPSIEVHVHAMRLIYSNGCKADKVTETLMLGLKSILAKARSEAEQA